MKRWIAGHRKVIVAIIGAAVTVAVQVWGTSNPYVSLAVLAATSLGVYSAPNTTPAPPPATVRAEKTLTPPAKG